MPQRSGDKLLEDIIVEGEIGRNLTSGLSFASYALDPIVRRVVERCLEIMGEAVRQLRASRPDISDQITGAAGISGLRNILAHEYYDIDDVQILRIVRERLPALLSEVGALLLIERRS